MRLPALIALLFVFVPAASARPCYTPEEAAEHVHKDVCIRAHVYQVVELGDGTRFLDVCKPDLPDEQCRFSIASASVDRKEVGELAQLEGQDIEIRGTVQPFLTRTEIVLSHVRQLHGGSEKFRPNPTLLQGFSADGHKGPINDPASRGGRHRTVFNQKH